MVRELMPLGDKVEWLSPYLTISLKEEKLTDAPKEGSS
jgi:hypothetical protein